MANGSFGGGNGTSRNPYLVEDAEDLNAVRNHLWAHYEQIADIDLSTLGEWLPIGSKLNEVFFTGTYDGGDYEINNLKIRITDDSERYSGMFAAAKSGATFKSMNLLNVDISGVDYVFLGSLLGYGNVVVIENCKVTGFVNAPTSGLLVGHLVTDTGDVNRNRITGCDLKGNVVALSGGGLMGAELMFVDIERCSVKGRLTVYDFWGGGFGSMCQDAKFSLCKAEIELFSLDSEPNNLGGFVGECYGDSSFTDCYSTGVVNGGHANGDGGYIGGMIGSNSEYGTITNCYSSVAVYGNSSVGGLIGYESESFVSVRNSFALNDGITATGDPAWLGDIGYLIGSESGMTANSFYLDEIKINSRIGTSGASPINLFSAKQKKTYVDAGWDFENIWTIREGESYPYFLPPKSKSKTKCDRIAITKLLGGY